MRFATTYTYNLHGDDLTFKLDEHLANEWKEDKDSFGTDYYLEAVDFLRGPEGVTNGTQEFRLDINTASPTEKISFKISNILST